MTQRILHQRESEAIAFGISFLPPDIARLVEGRWIDFFVGDPVFCGLHEWEEANHGRSYRTISQAVYETHYDVGRSTVVLPPCPTDKYVQDHNFSLSTVVHEIAHMIHEDAGFPEDVFPEVTEYAKTDDSECFAEAITAYLMPHGHGYGDAKDLLSRDDLRLLETMFSEDDLWRPAWYR